MNTNPLITQTHATLSDPDRATVHANVISPQLSDLFVRIFQIRHIAWDEGKASFKHRKNASPCRSLLKDDDKYLDSVRNFELMTDRQNVHS